MLSNCDENYQRLNSAGRGNIPKVDFLQRAQGFRADFSAVLRLHVEILQLRHAWCQFAI